MMKYVMTALVLTLIASPALAQKSANGEVKATGKDTKEPRYTTTISPGELTPTPEMWFYEQYQRQYQDPQAMVRKRAEFRADQRARRIASLKWFGYSNQRPVASSDPYHGDWSPSWKSNNPLYPSRWIGNGYSWIALRPDAADARAY